MVLVKPDAHPLSIQLACPELTYKPDYERW